MQDSNSENFYNQDSSFSNRSFLFLNQLITKKELEELLLWMFRNYGIKKTCILTELLKEAGFSYATQGGLSIGLEDLKVPRSKSSLVSSTNKELAMGETQYKRGELTGSEWFQKQVMAWNLTSEIVKNEIIEFFEKTDPLNPLYIMTFSGARGNLSQVRQLIGMRGLMSDQKGQMIGSAIQKNFREGLTVVDFLISSYGARKGLVDTAIRTADSGYMTRRLVDIAQDVIIRQFDCQARTGILILQSKPYSSFNKKSFSDRLIGKVLAKPIIDPKLKCLVAHRGQEIDFSLAHKIHELGIEIISVRSPLTCQSYRSICQTCFGWDLTQHKLIELGEAVGIIAAQSIGEPGTQLTMRTFHTGGVFSRELSQQIRSNYSGQIEFADNLKTQFIRTNQGDYAQIVRNTSFFEIRTYKNEQIRVAVERDDLLLVKNKSFIRKGQPIVQSASAMEDSDIEVQKTISTKFAGEIYYQPRQSYNFFEYNIIVWILAGILITLPFETKKFTRAYKPNSLVFGRTKLTIKSNPFTEKIFVFNQKIIALMCSFKKLKNFKILSFQYILKKDKKLLLLQHEKNNLVFLKKNLNQKNLQYVNGYIGRCATTAYKVQMSGNFYPILSSGFPARSRLNTWIEITKGGMYAWVPEESYKQLANNYSKEKQGNFVKKNLWLGYNCFSPLHGLVEQKKQVRKINELVIHSGVIFNLKEENVNLDKLYEKFAGQFFFPGEILFNKLKLNRVFYAQVFKNSVSIKVIFKPITIYSIPKSHRDYPIGHNLNSLNNELVLKLKRFLTLKPNEHLKANLECSKQIVQNGFFIENINPSTIQTFDILTNLRKVSESKWSLEVGRFQNFHNLNINPRRLNTQTIKKISSVRPGQVLEPYSLAGYCDIYENIKALPLDSKTQYSSRYQSQELLILSNTHIRELYFDEVLLSQYKKKFLFAGDSLFNSLVLGIGGKVLNFDASKLRFRIGKPYLFTEGAKVYKNHKDFAPENTILGFVSYRVFKTQDIIQGLPKVEEILEARGSSERAKIAEKTGLVTKILNYGQSNQVEVLSHIKQAKAICEIPYLIDEPKKEALDVEPYQYIGIADKFHKGLIDPQHLLDIFFDYYRQRDSHHKATLRSLYRLASMFIKSIQSVYESQGIQIVDRHLEIIVRQMIIKAKVEYAGETPLVAGEYLDIQQLVTLNKMLQSRNKVLVYYKPVVLGLTKAALTTESFLSAASFQETVRILTQAAIEGKVDWLRGLKEKVIIGGLIPSGTGILSFLDEWITKHIFLYGRSVVSTKTRRKFLRKKLEHQANQLFINSGEENYETYK